MKLYILILGLLLFTINAYTQNLNKRQFAEAKNMLSSVKDQSKKAQLLNRMALYYIMRNDSEKDIDSASVFNRQSLSIGNELGLKNIIAASMLIDGQLAMRRNNKGLASELKNKALQYAHNNNLKSQEAEIYKDMAFDFAPQDLVNRKEYILKALSLFKEAAETNGEADTYFDLAGFYESTGEPDSCFKYVQQAIKIKKNIRRDDLYKEYTILTRFYWKRGNTKDALDYALQADMIAEDLDAEPIWRALIYNLLGMIYNELDISDRSLASYKNALTMAKKSKSAVYVETIQMNAAINFYNHKKFGEALEILNEIKNYSGKECNVRYISMHILLYCQNQKYDMARPYYEQLLKCDKDASKKEQQAMYPSMIEYLLKTGQVNKTYTYIYKLKELANEDHNILYLREAESIHFKADSISGNYPGALQQLKKMQALDDSITNYETTQQHNNLVLAYDTEKKNKNIRLLKQQSKFRNEKIHNEIILRYGLIGGLAVLVLFVVLLYNRSRLKQKTNNALQRKQEKINEQNDDLKKLLNEKEWLLKEIHHRVKNNLQIVISLLNTQSAYLENKDALTAIQNSQHRMYAMSLIHQKLYQSDNLASIDMSWYIHELVNYLKECFGTADKKINYNLDTQPIEFNVTYAVPLGLILNEAISNAIKYAFTGKEKGNINIVLQKDADNSDDSYHLIIADNGTGLPQGFELIERESLGMDLMIGLTDQLDGTLELQNNNGLTIIITFRIKDDFI
jgi:two-component sensor histidine kinase